MKSLSSTTFANVTVYTAITVAKGSNFTGETLAGTFYNGPFINLPEHCRVAGIVKTSETSFAGFELWMPPASSWNRRYMTTGNGGWTGAVNYGDIVNYLRLNFATMSTDTGHNSSSLDGSWASNKEANIDFAIRAVHETTVAAKQIVAAYYDEEQSWSYYTGCSTGGRQGWVEAQAFPDDFDGILVGSPVIAQSKLCAWEIWIGDLQYPNTSSTFLSISDWTLAHEEVLRQCDFLDGVVDGLVSDPTRCNFVAETLLCSLNQTSGCLTPPQVTNLKRMYQPWIDTNNTFVFDGVAPGSELTGVALYTNAESQGGLGLEYYRWQVFNDSTWGVDDLTLDDVFYAGKRIPVNSDGANPDLRGIQEKGGKVLHFHGYQDSIVSAQNSVRYFKSVLSFMSQNNATSSENPVSDFYRLFLVPGMGHCAAADGAGIMGSPGVTTPSATNATDHSLLLSLVEWVEADRKPEYIIGTSYVNATESLGIAYTRPACLWPDIPVFLGGEVSDAGSWACPKSVVQG